MSADTSSTASSGGRLVVASNRLPFVLKRIDHRRWNVEPGSGGLVSALLPVLRNRGGIWVGWPGTVDADVSELETTLTELTRDAGYSLGPVMLTTDERDKFYNGFCNEIIWPLFHDLQTNCNFNPDFWRVYQQVNRKFARTLQSCSRADDFIWVHDYHLMGAARELRRLGVQSQLGFFLHIPFPSLDIFLKLPWRFEVLRSLLEFDLLGFQTLHHRRNFIQCARMLLKGVSVQGKGQTVSMRLAVPTLGADQGVAVTEREIRLGAFPIGIDYKSFVERAASDEVKQRAHYFHDNLRGRQLILGVDRLDYTKGIPYRLEAFRHALKRYPDMHGKVILIQQVVPSRVDIPEYHELRLEIEHLVSEINGEFTESGWVPIHYIYRNHKWPELLAYYRAADIALVTPLKDGMNLVAKEYCAAKVKKDGVLILSEFAGAAGQLQRGALLVNPHDIEAVADRIHEAFVMGHDERRRRMKQLRRAIRGSDIFWWVDSYLRAAIAKELSDFPISEEYIPNTESVLTG